MAEEEILEHARFIFTNGRIIREFFFRVHQKAFVEAGGTDIHQELSGSQLQAIITVREHQPVTIKELARLLLVSPPSASVMVDRLVEKGILTRQQSDQDRRKVVVSISPEAVRQMNATEEIMFRYFFELVKKIGPDTARKWVEVVGSIRQALKED